MTEREVLKLALEALKQIDEAMPFPVAKLAQKAIREALAQPEQEPVVWMYQDKTSHAVKFQRHMSNFVDHSKTSEIPLYSEPLANHELQCVCGAVWCGDEMVHLPNKIPPQPESVIDKSAAVRIATALGWEPKRKPLTDEEIDKLPWGPHEGNPLTFAEGLRDFARAIEAAHGIKE